MSGIENPIDWPEIESALHRWFAESTGVQIIWANQDATQPAYPYGTLNVISGPTKIGGVDENRCVIRDGQAILQTLGQREITVSCQLNVGKPNTHNPEMHSRALMSRAQSALDMQSFRAELRAAGLSVIEEQAPANFDLQVADKWISRTQMDVRFHITICIEEDIDTIETVSYTGMVSRAEGDPAPVSTSGTVS